jgi:hypothetical protein
VSVAVEKTSDSADGLTENQRWRESIGEFAEGNFFSPSIYEAHQKTPKNGTVYRKPTLPYSENREGITPKLRQVSKCKVIETRTDYGTNHGVEKKNINFFFADSLSLGLFPRKPQASDTCQGDHGTIPTNDKRTNLY